MQPFLTPNLIGLFLLVAKDGALGHIHPDLFGANLSPKADECVSLSHRAAMYRNKDGAWFEQTMANACAESRRMAKPSGIGVVVFANKETAGWEAMLGAMISCWLDYHRVLAH